MPNPLAATIIPLYERHADAWQRQRSPHASLEEVWLQRFAAGLPDGGRVLDLGCGTGQPMARWLARKGFAITGIDSSATMLALASRLQPDQEWMACDMRQLSLGRRFDGLLAWDSFFHLCHDDQQTMFDVFAAHAKPGSMLMFTSGPAEGEAIGTFEGEPLFHASLAPDTYRSLLGTSGFEVLDFVPEDPRCGFHTIWLARRQP